MSATAIFIPPRSPTSAFLRSLGTALQAAWKPEAELTMRIAVMSAGGLTRAEIIERTGAPEIEVKMAMLRLARCAEGL